MRKFVLALVLTLAASPAFAQDVFVKIKTHSDAMAVMGQSQPAKDDVSEQWFSGAKMAQQGKENGFIVDLDKKMAYMVNHVDKSYVELKLDALAQAAPAAAAAPAPAATDATAEAPAK